MVLIATAGTLTGSLVPVNFALVWISGLVRTLVPDLISDHGKDSCSDRGSCHGEDS